MNSDNPSGLPADVAAAMAAYLRLTDQGLPNRITGLYLVGSLALDDYRPGQSDIDFVAITDAPLTPAELDRLDRLHTELRRTVPPPKLDGVYVTWDELRREPIGLSAPHCLDGRFAPSGGFAANPVTWHMMYRHRIPMRGPATPVVWHDDEVLRAWCRENLQSYWKGWVRDARSRLWKGLLSFTRRGRVWGVLGVTRLHATIRTGDILSKSAAGTYALATFPHRWSPVIEDALGGRLGRKAASSPNIWACRRDALAFMEYVIADAMHAL